MKPDNHHCWFHQDWPFQNEKPVAQCSSYCEQHMVTYDNGSGKIQWWIQSQSEEEEASSTLNPGTETDFFSDHQCGHEKVLPDRLIYMRKWNVLTKCGSNFINKDLKAPTSTHAFILHNYK